MGNFKQIAQDSTIMSRLHKGAEKADTSVIVGKDLTVADFDIVHLDDGSNFAVFTFEEMKGFYYNAGIVATKIVTAWAEAYNNNVEAAAAAYQKEKEKVVLRFAEGKTKDGKNNLVTVEIL